MAGGRLSQHFLVNLLLPWFPRNLANGLCNSAIVFEKNQRCVNGGGDNAHVPVCIILSIQPTVQRRRGLGGVTWHQASAASSLSADSKAQSVTWG